MIISQVRNNSHLISPLKRFCDFKRMITCLTVKTNIRLRSQVKCKEAQIRVNFKKSFGYLDLLLLSHLHPSNIKTETYITEITIYMISWIIPMSSVKSFFKTRFFFLNDFFDRLYYYGDKIPNIISW